MSLPHPVDLRKEMKDLENRLAVCKSQLRFIEQKCNHDWTEPQRYCDRIYDAEANVEWRRSCVHCGLEQRTYRVKEKMVETPIFP